MTHPTDVARGRDIVARWCELAEQRLDYLTELYETGRWRRFHGEREFLENVREATSAVETWRSMLDGEASLENRPVDLSWIGKHSSITPAKREVPAEPTAAPQPTELPEALPVSVAPAMVEPEPVLALDPGETGDSALDQTLALTLDIVGMAQRYPLLRNAFQSSERN